MKPALHHVSIVVTDLARAVAFYETVLGLRRVARPPLRTDGAWFDLAGGGLHLIVHPGTFRRDGVDSSDGHFALRVADFEAALAHLSAHGFREGLPAGDPMHLYVNRHGPVGFPQAYLVDPDRNIIEINAAA